MNANNRRVCVCMCAGGGGLRYHSGWFFIIPISKLISVGPGTPEAQNNVVSRMTSSIKPDTRLYRRVTVGWHLSVVNAVDVESLDGD